MPVLKSLPTDAQIISDPPAKPLKSLPPDAQIIGIERGKPSMIPHIDDFSPQEDKISKTKEIIDRIPDLDEGKKDILLNVAKSGASKDQIGDALWTLQGKHPKQEGGSKYYLDDLGYPIPLKNSQRPPVGYDVASVWGTQGEADHDHPLTTIAKQVVNILPSIAENVVDLVHLPYGMSTGKEAEWYKTLKNSADALKLSTSTASKSPILNTQGIDEVKDIFDSGRWDFNPQNIAGTIGQVAKSVGEFIGGGQIVKGITGASSVAAKTGAMFTASYMTNLGEALDAGRAAGIDTKDAYRLASAITIPISLIDLTMGVEGRIFKDQIAAGERKTLIKDLTNGFLKDSEGKITKEGLDDLFKSTLISNTSLVKTWGKESLKNSLGEGVQESLQAFVSKAGEQIYDHLSDEDKKKFGTNAFSPKSMGEYINEGIAGLLGGVPSVLAYNKIKAINRDKEQGNTAFGLVQKGDEAANAYKHNIFNEVKQGKLTQEQADNAITRINSYKEYNDILGSLELPNDKKREAFDKTFQKQNLETEIEKLGPPDKLHPLIQAEYSAKEKFANELQKDINKIIQDAQVNNEPVVGNKIIEGQAEKEKPKEKTKYSEVVEALKNKYKTPADERSYEDVSLDEFNKSSFNSRLKHRMVTGMLHAQSDNTIKAEFTEREFGNDGNTVYEVKFPDGKKIRMASSMMREVGKTDLGNVTGGFRGWLDSHRMEKGAKVKGYPIGIKGFTLTTGKKVGKVFDANTGKTLGWIKETHSGRNKVGKGEYSEVEIKELEDIEDAKENPLPPKANIGPTPTSPVTTPLIDILPENVKLNKKIHLEENTSDKTINLEHESPEIKRVISLAAEHDNIEQEPNIQGIESAAESDQQTELAKAIDRANEIIDILKKIVNGKQTNPTNREEPAAGDDHGPGSENANSVKGKTRTLRTGTKKSRRKIKDPRYLKALGHQTFSPEGTILQYFIGGGKINPSVIKGLYKNSNSEHKSAIDLQNKSAPTLNELAHQLWESGHDDGVPEKFESNDYRDALEDVLTRFISRTDMAEYLNKVYSDQFTEPEIELNSELDKNETQSESIDIENQIDKAEELTDSEIENLAKGDQSNYNEWEKDNDIIRNENPNEEYPFQKESSKHLVSQKVVEHIQKVLPKINVVYDPDLKAAGQLKGNTILINPFYAGNDTPIHEAAHVLLDAIGENKVIKAAVDQLKGTELWKETKERYPELNDKALANEVFLAEAIGREGAGIFKTVVEQNKFKQFLNYIFDLFKQKFGLDRNIAKSLAKQIISGIGTKELTGTSEAKQKIKEKINKKDFNSYRDKILDRDVQQEKELIEQVKEAIRDPETSKEERMELEDALDTIRAQRTEDKVSYREYQKNKKKQDEIEAAKDLEKYSFDELVDDYKSAQETDSSAKLRLADYLNAEATQRLSKIDPNIREVANSKDMTWIQKWMKVLSDVSHKFPILQGLSKVFDERYMAKVQEISAKKAQHEKLGRAVIREKNRGLGILSDLINSNSAKYFNFLDDGGKLRTNTTGLTKAQKEYLDFFTNLVKDRNVILDEDDNIVDNTLIKIDKGFWEYFSDKQYKDAALSLLPKPSETRINYRGELTSRFDHAYKGTSYSKDFYKAAHVFIDDYYHVKYMKDLVPIVDGIELFYKKLGIEKGMNFDNTIKFLQEWEKSKIYLDQGSTDPKIDIPLRVLRKFTSMTVMAFNVPANVVNIAIGNYNTWREDGLKNFLTGQARLFGGGKKFDIDHGYGLISKKAMDILKKYDVVSHDYDSNPKMHVMKLFDTIAFAGLRWGEIQIQGSQFLGQITDKEYDSFEYKDDKLVLKPGVDKKAFDQKMVEYKNHVSDVQGKYSEKDRRNFMNYELGKSAAQFKVWVPDWVKNRFGEDKIDVHNNRKIGSVNAMFTKRAIKELRDDFNKRGIVAAWENKAVMANLKSAMVVATLLVAVHSGDDDKKKKFQALSLDNALANLLFVFDPQQLKYLLTSPVASIGPVTKFIDALDGLLHGNEGKFTKNAKKLIPYNKVLDVADLTK